MTENDVRQSCSDRSSFNTSDKWSVTPLAPLLPESTGIILSDVFVGMTLSSIAFLVEYYCDLWFESTNLSKHYRMILQVCFQLLAVIIALVLREVLKKFFQFYSKTDSVQVTFVTELLGVISGAAFVILILVLSHPKN